MKKALAMILATILLWGLVACGTNSNVIEVEDMTLEFLQEHGEMKGHNEIDGDIYLMGPYVLAVGENGEVKCIFEGAANVTEVSCTYVGQDRIPKNDGIIVLTLHGHLMVGNSYAGWQSLSSKK